MVKRNIEQIEILVAGEYHYASCDAHWELTEVPYGTFGRKMGDTDPELHHLENVALEDGETLTPEILKAIEMAVENAGLSHEE